MTDAPDSTPEVEEHGVLRIAPIEVVNFEAKADDMALSVTRTQEGTGVLAHAEREGESTIAVFMGWLKILAGLEIKKEVDGGGMLGISDQRAFGLLMEGEALGGRCRLDRRGNGQIAVYSFDKSLLNYHRTVEGRRGKIRMVNLIGEGTGALSLDVSHRLSTSDKFEKADGHDLLSVVQHWLP